MGIEDIGELKCKTIKEVNFVKWVCVYGAAKSKCLEGDEKVRKEGSIFKETLFER